MNSMPDVREPADVCYSDNPPSPYCADISNGLCAIFRLYQ